MLNDPIQVLDKGFIKLIDHMGSDLSVTNAARCSYGDHKEEFDEKDAKLVKYLATHEHTSPFRHAFVTLHMKTPLFVFNQIAKHQIGVSINSKSGRYVTWEQDEYYVPAEYRQQAVVNKQGSEGAIEGTKKVLARMEYEDACKASFKSYKSLLELGVCREQARAVLPQGVYTEFFMSMSLQALAHFIHLRTDSHAQWETQQYGQAVKQLGMELFPVSLAALLEVSKAQD